jgi:hypothetical protein
MKREVLDVAAVEALTRSRLERGGPLSDEELLQSLVHGNLGQLRLALLVEVSRLLRLMDSFVVGTDTGEGFVSKFSDRFLSIVDWEADPILDTAFDDLNSFYENIQMFSARTSADNPEPFFFGVERLRDLTQSAYVDLKARWARALENSAMPS